MEKENHCLKSGYILKLGLNNKWKTRRFALSEDHLICHQKRRHRLGVSLLALQGCSVVCPCFDDNVPGINPNGTFKICMPSGEEFYFQAAGEDERDRWAHTIGAVIRSLSTAKQISTHRKVPFQNFRCYANVSEILGAIQDPDAGVELGTHIRNGIVYRNCFLGKDVVEWLLRWSIVRTREDGSAMAQTLLKLGHLQEVDLNDGSCTAGERFRDDSNLYRYTSLNLGAKRNSYFDNTDSDSSSSEEEEEEDVETTTKSKLKKGKVIKETFLLKRKNLSTGWQAVKVILRVNPPTLEYHKALAVTELESFSKVIDLSTSKVKVNRKEEESLEKQADVKRLLISLKDGRGKRLTLQAGSEEERLDWLAQLQQLCGGNRSDK